MKDTDHNPVLSEILKKKSLENQTFKFKFKFSSTDMGSFLI